MIKNKAQLDLLKTIESEVIKIEKTFSGCSCGYHGYLVLPDCDEKDHGDKCAECLLKNTLQLLRDKLKE